MADWRPVGELDALREGEINKASSDGADLIVLRFGDELAAFVDACPHEGHPLCMGELHGDVLVCAKHLWEFDARSGAHISRVRRPEHDLRKLPVRVVAGTAQVDLSSIFE